MEFEVCWVLPAELLPGEIERYGATTLGGIGVPIPGVVLPAEGPTTVGT